MGGNILNLILLFRKRRRIQIPSSRTSGKGRCTSLTSPRLVINNYSSYILYIFKLGGDGKETFGTWDQSLNLIPAMSRSTEPRPRQWVLLAQSRWTCLEKEME